MPDFAGALGASKAASALLVLFIPSKDRGDQPIDQPHCVMEALNALGNLLGGATAFPQGQGIWRDDAQGGKLLFDEPVIIQCYTSEYMIEEKISELRDFLHRMGREARQGAIGLVIDGDYLEIGFPLEDATKPQRPKGARRGNDDGKEHGNDRRRAGCRTRRPSAGHRWRCLWGGTSCPNRRNHEDASCAGAGSTPGKADRCQLGASSQSADERCNTATAGLAGRAEQQRRA